MSASNAASGPRVGVSEVRFSYPDPERSLRRVTLVQDVARPWLGPPLRYGRRAGEWVARFPRHPVDRMEYQFELTRADGGTELVLDPGNPLRVSSPFGERSVVAFPGYRLPEWLAEDPEAGELVRASVPSRVFGGEYTFGLWSSEGSDPARPLPLLVAHDGPEYAEYSGLVRFLDAMVARGELPPMRAALLPPPGDRDERYSASAVYARALVRRILPAVAAVAPVPPGRDQRVALGASLGALTSLYAHRLYPEAFGALFLQSGSFFRRRLEGYESGFVRFQRIARFVDDLLAAGPARQPVPAVMTCGTVEENLASNRAVARCLAAQGYDVQLHEVRDAHNWIAWRDTWDPHLLGLLQRVWT